jgi:hypothetical protein
MALQVWTRAFLPGFSLPSGGEEGLVRRVGALEPLTLPKGREDTLALCADLAEIQPVLC